MGTRGVKCWVLVAAVFAGASVSVAEEAAKPASDTVTVFLKDGGRLVGQVAAEDATAITLKTASGIELTLPRDAIARIEETSRGGNGGSPALTDPNDTRLMFAPTGRPLGKGDGYLSNHYVLFPGVAYGLTKNLSLGGGISTVPGVGFQSQLFYVSAQLGFRPSEKAAFSVGGLYTTMADADEDVAVFYGVTTFGRPDKSLTLGFALANKQEERPRFGPPPRRQYLGNDKVWASEPIALVGGTVKVGRRLSFVTENWLFLQRPIDEQAFGLALRFFADRINVDAGFVFVPEVIQHGFPIPWLSFSYHFGPSRGKASRTAAGPMPGLAGGRPRGR